MPNFNFSLSEKKDQHERWSFYVFKLMTCCSYGLS